jgi:CubicO group peptidase (beta-lactamase class C family)
MLNFYALEQRIGDRLHAAHVPGLSVAIVYNHEVIYARGFGVTSVEDGGLPVTPQTLFRIGSVTKPLTGTAIMRLVDRGLVRLDAPVREYLPWFMLSEPGAAERVTVRMLLTHTSGIPISGTPLDPRTAGSGDPEALAARIRQEIPCLPLVAQPGTLWSYSNGAIHILGHIIEVVTSTFYTQSMYELVFAPLDMSRTTFEPTVAMTYPLAQAHDLLEDGSLRVQHRFANYSAHYPSGQAISTVLDLANFALLHLQHGFYRRNQVLSPEAVAEMHRSHVDFFTIPPSGYGLTFFIGTHKGLLRVAHGGAINTFGANFDFLPNAGAAVILLYNRRSATLAAGALVDEIFDLLLHRPADVPPSPVKPDRDFWPRYVGTYLGSWAGLARIAVLNDQLILEWNGELVPLEPFRDDLYAGQRQGNEQRISVGFYPPAAGETVSPYIVVNAMPCRRIDQDVDAACDPTCLHVYVGTYRGPRTFHLRAEADQLMVRTQESDEWAACISLGEGRFACRYGLLAFATPVDGASPTLTVGGELTLMRAAESTEPVHA